MKFFYFPLGIAIGFLLVYLFVYDLEEEAHLSPPEEPVSTRSITPAVDEHIIIDSNKSFLEAIGNADIPEVVKINLSLVDVKYYSFDNKVHRGQIIVNKKLAGEVTLIFNELFAAGVLLEKVLPVSYFKNSDRISMANNNTSAFNFRNVDGKSKLSKHAYGLAIDINPLYNPFIGRGVTMPHGSSYDPSSPYAITQKSTIYNVFKRYGWKWGGEWNSVKDYQHFEKEVQ